jgi:hypothetical protein
VYAQIVENRDLSLGSPQDQRPVQELGWKRFVFDLVGTRHRMPVVEKSLL